MTGRTTGGSLRAVRVSETREQILTAAERLFAEHGVYAVSNRQVSEAAGQGNNAAVGYHFGAKADLVRAIARKHAQPIERARRRMLAEMGDATEVRDWVACLVRPVTDHLAALGNPTWFARFGAQVMTDPALREIMIDESLTSPSLRQIIDGLRRALPGLPEDVRAERAEMGGQLMVHMCAVRENALAEGAPTPRSTWHDTATGLIDAITGMWLAPVTREP
ncbi:TetR/AcrR family transcriptional regulator [Nonomuraea sp. NPDC050383]|uniref:TetR/AcrR family transcriptional regulator n=1 Tax=Nonomuraea sp. NPDC050383 TaxID=3364362 RepID=UPI00379B6DD2